MNIKKENECIKKKVNIKRLNKRNEKIIKNKIE